MPHTGYPSSTPLSSPLRAGPATEGDPAKASAGEKRRNRMASALERLRQHLAGSISIFRPEAELFAPVDLQYVRDAHRLHQKATENGVLDTPASDRESPDAVELGIRASMEDAGRGYIQNIRNRTEPIAQESLCWGAG